jgi:hypothetical protein
MRVRFGGGFTDVMSASIVSGVPLHLTDARRKQSRRLRRDLDRRPERHVEQRLQVLVVDPNVIRVS